jgi:glutamate synthase (NADPH/NADH) large chain
VTRRQQVFGYTEEELRLLLAPMARTGAEPIGSMGTDTPVAALSERPRLLFDYFSQLFAQVTNPPLDAIREELVTSLAGSIGPEWNLLDPGPASCRQVVLPFPVIDNDELAKLIHINRDGTFQASTPMSSRVCTEVAGTARSCGVAWTRSAARWTRRSRPERTSSCSPTGTPPPTWHRSRRCC